MTDGVHGGSLQVGDPAFLDHDRIDPELADAWRRELPHRLGEPARELALRLAYAIPSEPAPPSDEARRERDVEAAGLRIRLTEWGPDTGEPVLCVHGILEQGAAWEEVASRLAREGLRVVAPDQRGHGHSSHIPPCASYHLLDFVADLDAVAGQLGPGRLTVVGHSMGAAVAALWAAARPARVQALVLVEPVSPGENAGVAQQVAAHLDYRAARSEHVPLASLEAAADRLRLAAPGLPEARARALAERLTEPCPGGVRWLWDPRLRSRTGLVLAGVDLPDGRYADLLARLPMPVVVVTAAEGDGRVAATVPGAEVRRIGGGHNLHLDAPGELARVILEAARKVAGDPVRPSPAPGRASHR